MGRQVIADKLFVKGWLAVAGLVAFQGPETAGVGCQHFVSQYHPAFFIDAEFKFRIGNDDPPGQCVFCTGFIERDRFIPQNLRIFLSFARIFFFEYFDTFFEADIFVMVAELRFRTGRIDRFRKTVAFPEPFRKGDPADGPVFAVTLPSAACDIAADYTFDRQHLKLFTEHTSPFK